MARIESGAFEGWTIDDEAIYSPEGIRWTPTDLNRWHWDRQLLREYEKRITRPMQLGLVYED